jgi:hypothetical protein
MTPFVIAARDEISQGDLTMDIAQIVQLLGQWIGPPLQALGNLIVGLLTWDLLFITSGVGVIIQGIKVVAQLRWQNVPTQLIVFVIGPVIGAVVAWHTWSYNEQVPWWLAGVVCSGLANLIYWVGVQKLMVRVSPAAADAINLASTAGTFSSDKGEPK